MKSLIGMLLIFSMLSCQEKSPRMEPIETDNLSSEQIDSILTEFKFQYESPIVLDSTDQVLIPISTELLEKRTKYSSDGYYSNDYPRYWNVLFYNRKTGDTHLLTEEKIRISRIHTVRNEYDEKNTTMENKVLYEIGTIDYNNDKQLNSKDPEYLFSSDINGVNLKRVSPLNEDLQHFKVISESNQILIRALRDVNEDFVFDREDESIWYKAEWINDNWQVVELIDSALRKQIERLYLEQWLSKK